MRVDRVLIKNFRGFTSREFEFPGDFNVLVGGNGSGKTSILDALAVGLGSIFLRFDDIEPRPIKDDEVRGVSLKLGQSWTLERQYPAEVKCTGRVNLNPAACSSPEPQTIHWARTRPSANSGTTRRDARMIATVSQLLQQSVASAQTATAGTLPLLPLVAYFGTGRLWLPKRESHQDVLPPGSRMLGYVDCLEPVSSPRPLFKWWKTREIEQVQRQERLRVLDAVKSAVRDCLELEETPPGSPADGVPPSRLREIRWDIAADELVASFESGTELPLHLLSDGYRGMIGLVADLAFRAAMLNPQLEDKVAQQTPGVVLIDELDQHLHPLWQRRVVSDLRRTFPRIQFIATTHSPFIIQSLDAARGESVKSIDGGIRPDGTELSIEDIAESLMGVPIPSRSKRYQDMYDAAREYYKVLKRAPTAAPDELAALKQRLDELSMPFSDNPAYHAFLEEERIAAGLGPSPR